MNTLAFIVRRRGDLDGSTEVIPTVDGVALTDMIHAFESREGMETRAESYSGLFPKHFDFGPLDLHYSGTSQKPVDAKPVLLGCSCGEWGCWPLLARITATNDTVTWSEFEQPHRKSRDYSAFGPFTFSRETFENAVRDLQRALNEPHAIPDWVERLCTAVRFARNANATVAGLFASAAPDLSDRVAFCNLVTARLRREPALIDEWENFSADNRGTPSAYFRGCEAGTYDNGLRDVVQHDNRANACADYLFRKSVEACSRATKR